MLENRASPLLDYNNQSIETPGTIPGEEKQLEPRNSEEHIIYIILEALVGISFLGSHIISRAPLNHEGVTGCARNEHGNGMG